MIDAEQTGEETYEVIYTGTVENDAPDTRRLAGLALRVYGAFLVLALCELVLGRESQDDGGKKGKEAEDLGLHFGVGLVGMVGLVWFGWKMRLVIV